MSKRYSLKHHLLKENKYSIKETLSDYQSLLNEGFSAIQNLDTQLGAGGPTAHRLAQHVINKKMADYCQMVKGGGGADVVMYKNHAKIANIECKEGGSAPWTEMTSSFRMLLIQHGCAIDEAIVPVAFNWLKGKNKTDKYTDDEIEAITKTVIQHKNNPGGKYVGRIPTHIDLKLTKNPKVLSDAKALYNDQALIQKVKDWVDGPDHADQCEHYYDGNDPLTGEKWATKAAAKVWASNWKVIQLGPGYGAKAGQFRIIPHRSAKEEVIAQTIGKEIKFAEAKLYRKRTGYFNTPLFVHLDRLKKIGRTTHSILAGWDRESTPDLDSFNYRTHAKGAATGDWELLGRALVKQPTEAQLEEKFEAPHPRAGQKKYRMGIVYFPAGMNQQQQLAFFDEVVHAYCKKHKDNYFYWNNAGTAYGGSIDKMPNPMKSPRLTFIPLKYDATLQKVDDKGVVTHQGGFTLSKDRGTGTSGIRQNVEFEFSKGHNFPLTGLDVYNYSSTSYLEDHGAPGKQKGKRLTDSGKQVRIFRYTNKTHLPIAKRFVNYWPAPTTKGK